MIIKHFLVDLKDEFGGLVRERRRRGVKPGEDGERNKKDGEMGGV